MEMRTGTGEVGQGPGGPLSGKEAREKGRVGDGCRCLLFTMVRIPALGSHLTQAGSLSQSCSLLQASKCFSEIWGNRMLSLWCTFVWEMPGGYLMPCT